MAHHSPLYQDKAATPTSLKDIFTPIWSGPSIGRAADIGFYGQCPPRHARDQSSHLPGNPRIRRRVLWRQLGFWLSEAAIEKQKSVPVLVEYFAELLAYVTEKWPNSSLVVALLLVSALDKQALPDLSSRRSDKRALSGDLLEVQRDRMSTSWPAHCRCSGVLLL